MMDDQALRSALAAVAAACRVARSVQQDLARARQITKDDRSPVTVADFAVQAVVAMALRDAFGGRVPIVGEEHARALRQSEHDAVRRSVVEAVRSVRPGIGEPEVLDAIDACDHDATGASYWTLDPVDGTKGFLRGQQYAVALARITGGRVEVAAMGCPNLPVDFDRPLDAPDPDGAIYAARTGAGAWQWRSSGAGEPVAIHASVETGDAVRICESVEAAHSKHGDVQRVAGHLGVDVTYHRLDSQCKYAIVARGQADAYLRMPTRKVYVEKIWDHAAGALIAAEAGAVVTDIAGAPLDFGRGARLEANRGVVCASRSVHARIIEAIEVLGIAAPV